MSEYFKILIIILVIILIVYEKKKHHFKKIWVWLKDSLENILRKQFQNNLKRQSKFKHYLLRMNIISLVRIVVKIGIYYGLFLLGYHGEYLLNIVNADPNLSKFKGAVYFLIIFLIIILVFYEMLEGYLKESEDEMKEKAKEEYTTKP